MNVGDITTRDYADQTERTLLAIIMGGLTFKWIDGAERKLSLIG